MAGDAEEVILNDKQKIGLKESFARLNLFEGAVRSGKSVIANVRWLDYVLHDAPKKGDFAFTGVSNDSIIRNIINPIKDLVGTDIHYTTNPLKATLWGRKYHCFGAGSASSLTKIQGSEFAGCLSDEFTRHHKTFLEMMGTRLSIKNAKWFGTCNPDSPYHFVKTDYIDNDERDIYVQKYLIDDNPTLNTAYVNDLKNSYSGVFYDRYILGKWVLAQGAIYDFFEEKYHTIKNKDMPVAQYYAISIDYGTKNPFSAGLYGINHESMPKVWRMKEFYYDSEQAGRQLTDSQYADRLDDFINSNGVRNNLGFLIIDPSALSFKQELESRGYIVTDADNSVLDGIRNQASMLQKGEYMVGEDCPQCIEDYTAYLWSDQIGIDAPIKMYDHTKDEERYLLLTIFKNSILNYHILTK